MATAILTEKEIRLWIQDRPEYNTLLDGVRWTGEDIEQAQVFVVDYFNLMPPPISYYSIENFPSRALLLLGTCGHLLRGSAVQQASNNLTYSADGVQVDDQDKSSVFTELGMGFWKEFKELGTSMKVTQNINAAYGAKYSEWITRARYY